MSKELKTIEQRFMEAVSYAKVASFDMFDTLVQRTVHPKAIQHQVVSHASQKWNIPHVRAQELRDAAWEMAASMHSSQGLDHEAPFTEWMRQWVWLISLEPGVRAFSIEESTAAIIALEIRLESECLRVNEDVRGLMKAAQDLGKRVIVTSDMYLERKHLKILLNNIGIYVDDIFVSSEYGLTKRSGRLFKKIAAELGVGAGEIAHIGDNIDADMDGANSADLDIMTTLYDKPSRLKRIRQKEFAWDQFIATGDAGEMVRIAAEDGSADLRTGFIGYGHDVFGAAISTFIKQVAEIAETREIDRVYFMAREGFLLKMVYDLYLKSLPKGAAGVPADYLCVSRLTTLKVTSSAYGLREVALGTVHATTSVRKALGSMVGDLELLASVARRYGFDDIDELFDQYFHPMFHLLVRDDELNSAICASQAAARSAMEAYLDGIGLFDSKNILVVDVGWAGQIQESFDMFLKSIGREINVHGAYLATNHVAELRRAGEQVLMATIADRNIPDYYSNSLFRNVDLLETICRAPHGSVIGYKDGLPVESSGDKRAIEAQDDPMLSQMQKGVALYAATFFKLAQAFGFSAAKTSSTAKGALLRLHRFPELREAVIHQKVGHVASHWIGDKSEIPVAKSLRTQWAQSHWKEGFIRSRFGLAGLAALSFRVAIRKEHVIEQCGRHRVPEYRISPLGSERQVRRQPIETKAWNTFTENWLRTDIDDGDIGTPYLRDRHILAAAALARLHSIRNRYGLKTPVTMTIRYAVKRKLFVEYPNTRKVILKARHLLWRVRNKLKV